MDLGGAGRVAVIAHRGASLVAPPNTLVAFARAAELGADGVELDVRTSADGVPVVMHDPTVDATTNLTGLVSSHSAATLASADAAWNFRDGFGEHRYRGEGIGVPTLEEALELCAARGLVVDVEIKNVPLDPAYDPASTLAVDVARRIHDRGETDRVFLSSFNADDLRAVREAVPDVAVALLSISWAGADALEAVRSGGFSGWNPAVVDLFSDDIAALVSAAREAGCWVAPWTVNEQGAIRRLADAGVDAVITDVPDVARRALP